MRSGFVVLSIFLATKAFAAGDIRLGSKVDLTCTEGEGRHHNKISLTIREKGPDGAFKCRVHNLACIRSLFKKRRMIEKIFRRKKRLEGDQNQA